MSASQLRKLQQEPKSIAKAKAVTSRLQSLRRTRTTETDDNNDGDVQVESPAAVGTIAELHDCWKETTLSIGTFLESTQSKLKKDAHRVTE
eukprot:4965362-Amphidinium_carterae.1